MKICLIGAHLPPVMGGIEVHMWELARQLTRAGHQVFLIGHSEPFPYNDRPRYEQQEGLDIYRVGYFPGLRKLSRALGIISRALSLHKRYNFDIFHCHYFYPTGIIGAILNCWTGVPVVVTEHGSIIDERKIWWKRGLLKISAARIKKIITASRELYDLCLALGIHPEQVVSLPNAVDGQRFKPDISADRIRGKYGVKGNEIVVLALRRIVPKTGIQYLVEAAKFIVAANKRVKFLLVGQAINEKFLRGLKQRIKELGLDNYFIFAGGIKNEEVVDYIAGSDLAVFPSLAEATSIACLEVMAGGKPVVASAVGGLTEIITDGLNGFLIDFGTRQSSYEDRGVPEQSVRQLAQSILKLSEDENLRQKIGREARRTVEDKFSWESYIKKIINIYEQ